MNEWIDQYIRGLVRNADQVTVTVDEGIKVMVYTVVVSSEDMSLFAGRSNRLVRALNSALALAGAKTRTRHVVKIVA